MPARARRLGYICVWLCLFKFHFEVMDLQGFWLALRMHVYLLVVQTILHCLTKKRLHVHIGYCLLPDGMAAATEQSR